MRFQRALGGLHGFFQRGVLGPAQNFSRAIALHYAVKDLGIDAGIAAEIGVEIAVPQAFVAHHPGAGAA